MTTKNQKIITVLLSLVILLSPLVVFAEYTLLEPSIVGQSRGVTSPGINTYLGWLYNAFFAIIAIITFLVIVSGGVDYVTSSIPEVKANGKEKITRALKGFILALVAWLILETISSGGTFTNFRLNLEGVGTGTTGSAGPSGGNTETNTTGNNQDSSATGRSNTTDADARKTLSDMGISVNATEPRTSLAGIQSTTIDGLRQIQKDCPNCSLTVTGGTENTGVHSASQYSHVNGYKVDLAPNAEINSYFSGWKFIGNRNGDNAPQYQNGNMIAADERNIPGRGPHWDLQVKP